MTIDELIVKLTLDATGYTQGQKDAASATTKATTAIVAAATASEKAQTGSHTKITSSAEQMAAKILVGNEKIAASFEKALRVSLGFLAVLAGTRSIIEFTSQIVGLDTAVGRLAANTGSTPERISAIGRAAERR